jgi:hypothetical protein
MQNPANVYLLWEDFTSWNSTLWGAQPGAITLASSIATFTQNSAVHSTVQIFQSSNPYNVTSVFGYKVIMAALLPSLPTIYGSYLHVGMGFATSGINPRYRAYESGLSSNWMADSYDNSTEAFTAVTLIDVNAYHTYTVARRPGGKSDYWQDFGAGGIAHVSTQQLNNAEGVILNTWNDAGSSGHAAYNYTLGVDWVAVAPYIFPETNRPLPTPAVSHDEQQHRQRHYASHHHRLSRG